VFFIEFEKAGRAVNAKADKLAFWRKIRLDFMIELVGAD
tara:strand:- start:716 stop:832 length:117 start_codon:yes stop_codon:yes gene_type:complete